VTAREDQAGPDGRADLGFGAAAAAVWLALTYWLPWSIVTSTRHPVLAEMNGSWLVWVVATQSVAIIAAAVSPQAPSSWLRDHLPVVAICLWAVGVMLYVIRHYARTYEPRLWNVVFPLGMYTVASWSLGHAAAGLTFMTSMARVWFWLGLSAWTVVLVLMLLALLRAVGGRVTTGREAARTPPGQ
jgi:Voltage-dependent anion channel